VLGHVLIGCKEIDENIVNENSKEKNRMNGN